MIVLLLIVIVIIVVICNVLNRRKESNDKVDYEVIEIYRELHDDNAENDQLAKDNFEKILQTNYKPDIYSPTVSKYYDELLEQYNNGWSE